MHSDIAHQYGASKIILMMSSVELGQQWIGFILSLQRDIKCLILIRLGCYYSICWVFDVVIPFVDSVAADKCSKNAQRDQPSCQLHTPDDATCTHIHVFPTSATKQVRPSLLKRPYAHHIISVERPHLEVKKRPLIGQTCAPRVQVCVLIVSSSLLDLYAQGVKHHLSQLHDTWKQIISPIKWMCFEGDSNMLNNLWPIS